MPVSSDEELDQPPVGGADYPKLLIRAARLRCPHCGSGGIFRTFLELKLHCPGCGLRLERGEDDHFIGAYLLNLIAVELIVAFCIVLFLVATWPTPPWNTITYVSASLALLGCVLCYPFAKTTFLAVDLALRPVTDAELEWHRADGRMGDRELPHI